MARARRVYRRNSTKGVEAVMRGRDGDEFQIGSSDEVWTLYIMEHPETGRPYIEIKISPFGMRDEWDRDAYWIDRTREEVHSELDGRQVHKLT